MTVVPDPVWPVLVLAVVQLADAVLCRRPVTFIAQCLDAVGFPHRWWWVLTPLKVAAAAGLVAGLWVPSLGAATCTALVAYFLLAVGAYLRARDLGRTLFVNATGMLVLSAAVGLWCFG